MALSRNAIFALLAVAAAVVAVLAGSVDGSFGDTALTETFWLIAGVLFTTFVLEAVLRRDADQRDRDRDRFALRAKIAITLRVLDRMVPNSTARFDPSAASLSQDEFARSAENAARNFDTAVTVNAEAYTDAYIAVSSHLRDIATTSIRLFSESRDEMIANSIALHDLADEWSYEPDLLLSDRIREVENDVLRDPDNHYAEERLAEDRQRFHAAQLASAGRIHRTAIALADVARKATGTGYYADL